MQNHLLDSTASYKSGIGPNQRLFRVPSGEYAGRIVVLLAVSSSEIKIAYSDYPFAGWNEPTAIISDGADYPFDAVMDGDGNIYLCYTFGSNHDLVIRKLSFFGGLWSAGSLNTIYNGDDNYFPSLAIESNGRLWVSYSRLSGGVYYINAKYSDDWGVTWNLGISSPGTTLSSSGGSAYSKMAVRESYIYCIYEIGGTKLAYRRKHFNISTWDTEIELAGGSGLDYHFDVAVSADGKSAWSLMILLSNSANTTAISGVRFAKLTVPAAVFRKLDILIIYHILFICRGPDPANIRFFIPAGLVRYSHLRLFWIAARMFCRKSFAIAPLREITAI
jgi:hypothetical protein